MIDVSLLIVPIGGTGERFRKSGELVPKPLIRVGDRSQLQWALEGALRSYRPKEILLGVRSGICDLVQAEVKLFTTNSVPIRVIDVGNTTRGAADTVSRVLSSKFSRDDGWFVVVDSDVFCLQSLIDSSSLDGWDAFISTTNSMNPEHSFVETNGGGRITSVVEKRAISARGVSGHYGFRSVSDFVDAFNKISQEKSSLGEVYMSKVSNFFAETSRCLEWPSECVFSLGTPDEVATNEKDLRIFAGKLNIS
jgi:NDP-sugar pyrophosphorylase family protein